MLINSQVNEEICIKIFSCLQMIAPALKLFTLYLLWHNHCLSCKKQINIYENQ
jgi:hypothetical protein